VREYVGSPLALDAVMLALRPPADHRFFVAPDRKRKHESLGVFGGEPLIVDETVNRLELRLQLFRQCEIIVPTFPLRLDFEDDGEHVCSPWSMDGEIATH